MIRHFGLKSNVLKNRITETEGPKRNTYKPSFALVRGTACTRGTCRFHQFLKQAVPTEYGLM